MQTQRALQLRSPEKLAPTFLSSLLALAAFAAFPFHAAGASSCNVVVDHEGHAEATTSHAFYYPSSVRFFLRATTPDCSSVVLTTNKPSWVSIRATQGNASGVRDGIAFRGSGAFVVEMATNPGPSGRAFELMVRNTNFTKRIQIYQNIRQPCLNSFARGSTADTSTWLSSDLGPSYVTLRQTYPAPTSAPFPIFFRFKDTTTCPSFPAVMFHSTNDFQAEIFRTGNEYLVRSRAVPPSDKGAAAVMRIQTGRSSVATLLVRPLKDLPPDLQITKQSMNRSFLALGSSGGQVEITGRVDRPRAAGRRCAFTPDLYTSTDPAITVTGESGCNSGDPDSGKLVIRVAPTSRSERYGIVFNGWGYAFWVIQE